MQGRAHQGLCIQSCGPNTVERLTKYHIFGPAVTIMRRVSQVRYFFTSYSGRLCYPGQLFYYHWFLYILLFHLERKAFCRARLISGRTYADLILDRSRFFSHRFTISEDPISRHVHADSIENCAYAVPGVLSVGPLFDSMFSPFFLEGIKDFTKAGLESIICGLFAFLSLRAQAVGVFGSQLLDSAFHLSAGETPERHLIIDLLAYLYSYA